MRVRPGPGRVRTVLESLAARRGAARVVRGLARRCRPKRNDHGALAFPFVARRLRHGIQILLYHRVGDGRDPYLGALPVDFFRKHMEYLAGHGHVCALSDAVRMLQARDVPPDTVVITFDDGYRDNFLHAYPVLLELRLPATIFLATDAIGSGKILWHDRVFHAFHTTQARVLERFGPDARTYRIDSPDDRQIAREAVLRFLRTLDDTERGRWIDRLVASLRVESPVGDAELMLSWSDVTTMRDGGTTFGSHTMTHPILSRLTPERTREEVEGSKRTLELRLGTRVDSFAYPSGSRMDFDRQTKRILHDVGFGCALTTIRGSNEAGQDLFELRRGGPWSRDPATFGLRLEIQKLLS